MKHPGAALQAAIFDLDGTLVDTADDFIPVVQALRAEHGLAPMAPGEIRSSVSNGSRALVSLALGLQPGQADFEDARQRLLDLYGAILGTHARLYPGMEALLQQLQSRGIGWGIATNKPRAYTEPLLHSLGLQPVEGAVTCPEDLKAPKPHPESVERICAALGADPAQSIYAGDHARDIEAGRRGGLYTIAASYGYVERDDDPRLWGADALAASSEQLAALVLVTEDEFAPVGH